jgi:hypothetical protein
VEHRPLFEERYPDKPTLFGDDGAQATTRFLNIWSDTVLMPIIRRLISADFLEVLAPEDRPYFRSSRESAFGQTLEAASAARPALLAQLETALLPLELLVPMVGKVVGKAIALSAEDKKKGALIDWIKAEAQREGVHLPDGWKAEVARQFAIEWAKGNALSDDLLGRAEALFKEIGRRIADIA